MARQHGAVPVLLLALLVVAAALGADLVRRLARIDRRAFAAEAAPEAPVELVAGVPRPLTGHAVSLRIDGIDAGTVRLTLVVIAGRDGQLGECVLDSIALGGQPATPTSPRRAHSDASTTLELPLAFADVTWNELKDPPCYEAELRLAAKVRNAGEPEAATRTLERAISIRLDSGPHFEAIRAAKGRGR